MTRTIALSLLAAAAVMTPCAASAHSDTAQTTAVAASETRARLDPRDGGAQIELAQAYLRAHRAADAERAYRRALGLDNAMLETRNGDAIWSHQVATLALAHTTTVAHR